jgi:hypothetical protein
MASPPHLRIPTDMLLSYQRSQPQPLHDEVPTCSMCMEVLGTYGGPASLPCGHNGCLACLQQVEFPNPILSRVCFFSPLFFPFLIIVTVMPNFLRAFLASSSSCPLAAGADALGHAPLPALSNALRSGRQFMPKFGLARRHRSYASSGSCGGGITRALQGV